MRTILPVENGDTLKALQGFLSKLLESGVVDLVLTPMRTPYGTIAPALVSRPDLLAHADPLAPVMPVNGATLAGKLSFKNPRPKVAVVLRSCELRALIELTKLQQASLDDLLLVAVDCAGTISVPHFNKQPAEANAWQELFQNAAAQPETPKVELRPACKMCEQPVFAARPDKDVAIELLGADLSQGIPASLPDELASKLGLADAEQPSQRAAVLEKLVAARIAQRDAEFTAMRARLEVDGNATVPGIAEVFAACIRCHNCMTVCPICYCKQCVFKSAVFDHEPMQLANWAHQKGAYRMPSDTTLFHMTRLNHIGLSCVGCGMCTEACPSEIPVGVVFRSIGQRLQATFEYTPGRSLDDPLPLVTFKADEWNEVGE